VKEALWRVGGVVCWKIQFWSIKLEAAFAKREYAKASKAGKGA
jgi:hypothetical protein